MFNFNDDNFGSSDLILIVFSCLLFSMVSSLITKDVVNNQWQKKCINRGVGVYVLDQKTDRLYFEWTVPPKTKQQISE